MFTVALLSLLALATANPIRPDEEAARARQIADLNLQIAENNRLHGGSHFAQVLGHGGLLAAQPDFANLRADERVAFQRMQAELAGLVAQQRALEASAPSANPVSAIFPNLPQPDIHNPAATAAQQAQIRQLVDLVNAQRSQLANPSAFASSQTFVPASTSSFVPSVNTFRSFESAPAFASGSSFTTTSFDADIRDDDLRNLADAQRKLSEMVAKNERLHGTPSAIFQGDNSLFRINNNEVISSSFASAPAISAPVSTSFEQSFRSDDAAALAEAQRRLDGLVAMNEHLHGVPRAIFQNEAAFFPAGAPLVAPRAGELFV